MNAVGVIPARWGSTRFPGKILAPLCGKPLVQWVYERACQARRLPLVLVATDDERIRDAVEGFGGRAVMTRTDHPSGTDRAAEAVEGTAADVVVNIQGDEPLVDPAILDRMAQTLEEDDAWDMATAATPIRGADELLAPSAVKVVCDRTGRALYFSRSVIPHVRDEGEKPTDEPLHWRHLGLYAYRRACLDELVQTPPCATEQAERLEQLRALHLGYRIHVLQVEDTGVGVDTPEDLARAEELIRRAGLV
jgi:3-deoxy-manno-octulosonate cytidylyltransferase (CMP-KDO synthetase)